MKKSEQIQINAVVDAAMTDFEKVSSCSVLNRVQWKKLRSCSAQVAHVDKYYVLMSYNTIVAIIDIETDTLYDFLRKVYGYTSTSAQHIAKFNHDYGFGSWGCENRYTWRDV